MNVTSVCALGQNTPPCFHPFFQHLSAPHLTPRLRSSIPCAANPLLHFHGPRGAGDIDLAFECMNELVQGLSFFTLALASPCPPLVRKSEKDQSNTNMLSHSEKSFVMLSLKICFSALMVFPRLFSLLAQINPFSRTKHLLAQQLLCRNTLTGSQITSLWAFNS